MFLFNTDRSINAFLLLFLVLLVVEVAGSIAFKYVIEINDKYGK
jgi:hypothetical protein